MRNRCRQAAFVVAVLSLLAACGGDDSSGTDSGPSTSDVGSGASSTSPADGLDGAHAAQCTEATAGGEVSMGVIAEVRSLDPAVEAGTGQAGDTENAAIYDTLVRWDAAAGEYVPHLAESLESNDDASVWTLHLRPDVHFGNGDPLDAEAVKASIERHRDPATRSVKNGLASNIAEIIVVDELTVRFDLTGGWGRFPYLLAGQVGMITNPAVVTERGEELGANPAGAGAGPFEFVRFVPGEEIVLQAKSDYWGGPVCIDTLRFVSLGGPDASYEGLLAGTVDVTLLTDAAAVARAHDDGYEGPRWLQNMGGQILINNGAQGSTPITADVRVRRAVALAIDPEFINERAYAGHAEATSAIFAEGSRYYQGLDGPAYDVQEARSLVAEVVAEGAWDGTIRLVCSTVTGDVSLAVAALLEAAGFSVERDASLQQSDQITRVIVDADYDLACWGNNMYDDGDPWAILDSQLRSDASSNYRGYVSPEWDDAVGRLRGATTLEESTAVLGELQDIWNETIPSMNYRAVENFAPTAANLHGILPSHEGILLFGDAYLD